MPAKSPNDIKDPTLRMTIKANGAQIKDYYPVVSVNVTRAINRISSAEIVFIDGTIEQGEFPLSESDDLIPGSEIEILAGYGQDAEVSIFKGLIVKQSIRIGPSETPQLVVTCKHKAVTMTFNRMEQEFTDTTDSDVIKKIIGGYGLSCETDSTTASLGAIFQKLATDWDFILSRAEFNGLVTILEDDKIVVKKPDVSGDPVLNIEFGSSVIHFNAELNAEKQAPSLSASAWDIKNQALLKKNAAEPSLSEQGNLNAKSLAGKLSQKELSLSSGTPMSADELKSWADSTLLRMRMSAIKGSVSFTGNAGVKPGTVVNLSGVGKRFNGKAYVSAVTHTIEEGGWTTRIKFGWDPQSIHEQQDFSYPAATGQLPAIQGLQVGTVIKNAEDPEALYRIQVNFPSNATDQTGLWARPANFYATSGAGAFFMPEVGDEVVVGFLESDPRYPVILGALYSSANKPGTEEKDTNNYIKALTTKSKLKISFDDEKKITTIETPAGNIITLDDDQKCVEIKDQNSNSLKLDSNGITLQSNKDVHIKATGNINIEATGKISGTAQQDVELSGMNVKNTAQAGFTAKGNASAEISASGQTVVKGGMVMIN